MKKIDYSDMEDLYDNMADLMADQEEINELMCRDFGVGEFNEDELMDELNELDEEIAMEEMNGQVPSGKAKVKEEGKNEEEQLNDLMNY